MIRLTPDNGLPRCEAKSALFYSARIPHAPTPGLCSMSRTGSRLLPRYFIEEKISLFAHYKRLVAQVVNASDKAIIRVPD